MTLPAPLHHRSSSVSLLAIIAASGFALAACQSNSKTQQTTASPTSATSASEPAPAARPQSADYSGQIARSTMRERALEILTQAAVSNEPLLRANAIEGFLPAPSRAENAVRAGLADENPGVRFVAAVIAGQLKLKNSMPFVKPLLDDTDPRVRAGAIYAMHALGQKVDPSPLAEMLTNDDPQIRSEAARTLGELKNPSAIPMLKSAAVIADNRNRSRSGGSGDERQFQMERIFQLQVAEALVKLGDSTSIDAIRSALYPSGREGLEAAAFAAQILGSLRWQKSAGELVSLVEQKATEETQLEAGAQGGYQQPKEIRLAAATALAKMGFGGGLYVGQMYEADPDPAIRAQAAFLFGAIGSKDTLPSLNTLMNDPSPLVQVAASAATLKALKGS